MVFLVFLEVLEMSSEVVGPGPNTREIKSPCVDPPLPLHTETLQAAGEKREDPPPNLWGA